MKDRKVNLCEELIKLDVEDADIIALVSDISVKRYYKDHYFYLRDALKSYIETMKEKEERMAYIKTEKNRYNECMDLKNIKSIVSGTEAFSLLISLIKEINDKIGTELRIFCLIVIIIDFFFYYYFVSYKNYGFYIELFNDLEQYFEKEVYNLEMENSSNNIKSKEVILDVKKIKVKLKRKNNIEK